MGDVTGIEWTDHTFNPWWGCVRVSPACEHCYAETFAARFGVKWGVKAERRPSSAKVWSGPAKWNAAAEKEGRRHRVFCASMADVFEDQRDLDEHRERLWNLIHQTPWLDWQLLTKRPEAVMRLLPEVWTMFAIPRNVWIGTTVEDARRASERLRHLRAIPAAVRFLSCEPLLGRIEDIDLTGIGWVICGGESGPGARPMHQGWARELRNQCMRENVPFFFKQWGDWAPANGGAGGDIDVSRFDLNTIKASGMFTYNDDWLESPGTEGLNPFRQSMVRVGKKAAGSLLDGVSHKAFPGV